MTQQTPAVAYEFEVNDDAHASMTQNLYGRSTTIRPRKVTVRAGGWIAPHRLWVIVEGRVVRRDGEPSRTRRSLSYDDEPRYGREDAMSAAPKWVLELVEQVREWERRRLS